MPAGGDLRLRLRRSFRPVTIAALGSRDGDRLNLIADAGVMIARRDPAGMECCPLTWHRCHELTLEGAPSA